MKSDNPLESLGKDAPINLPTSTEDEIVVAKVNTSAFQEPAETRLENGLHEALSGKGARSHAENTGKEKGRNIVTWDGPSDPANPKNWPLRRRWASCVLLSLFNFVGPLSSAIIAPALPTMQTDLRTSDTIGVMFLSIYMLAFSIGPLITSPLSEMYGRLVVLQGSNIFFFIFNTACGFAKTDSQMLAFRFLSGMGGCAAQSIGGAIMGEIFTPLERGKAISVYSIAPLLGPVIGPVCGGLLTQYASWKWCFWVISIFDVFVQFCGIVYLRETYPPVLLRQKRGLLAKETGNQELRTEFDGNRTWSALLQKNMKRPFNMLATQPIVQVMSLYAGYGYGLAFLLSATMPLVWEGLYNQKPAIASLNYLPSGIGVIVMSQITPRLGNIIYKRLIARTPESKAAPEFRVPLLFPATLLTLVGLLWYGWSAEEKLHVAMPNIGTVIFTAGTNMTFFCINQYLIDTYTLHAASALGAATVLRGLCGFCIPLFAPNMFEKLGFGIGNTILAVTAVVIGLPGALIVWKWGPALREKSLYARK